MHFVINVESYQLVASLPYLYRQRLPLTKAEWFSSSVVVVVSEGKKYRGKDQPPLQRDLLNVGPCSIYPQEMNLVLSSFCLGQSQGSMVHTQRRY